MAELIYEKWGTRLAVSDEGDPRLQEFVFDGTRATSAAHGWELLQGPPQRVDVGTYDGEDVVAYLWPVARPGGESRG